MADPTVTLKFFGNTTALEKEVIKLGSQLDKIKNKGKAVGKSAAGMSKGFGGAANAATSMLRSMLGVGAAIGVARSGIQLLKREFEDFKQRQAKAAQTQLSMGGALRQARLNLGNDLTIKDMSALKQTISGISQRTSVSPLQVTNVLSSGLSARGNLPASQVAEATEAVLSFVPNLPDAQTPLAGAVLDIQKLSPKDVSAKDVVGFLAQLGTEARVTQTAALAENIAPAVAAVKGIGGGTFRESGALVAAISQGMFDTQGRRSGTAAIGLSAQLREGKGLGDNADFAGLTSTRERIEFLQDNPALAAKFLDKASFEKKAQNTVEQLLTKDTAEARNFAGAMQRLPRLTEGVENFNRLTQEINNDPSQLLDATNRAFGSSAERQFLGDTRGAVSSVARKGLEAELKAIGAGTTDRTISGLIFEARGGNLGATIQELESRRRGLVTPKPASRGFGGTGGGGFAPGFQNATPVSADDFRKAAELSILIKQLEDLNQRMEIANGIARDNGLQAEKQKLNRNGNAE